MDTVKQDPHFGSVMQLPVDLLVGDPQWERRKRNKRGQLSLLELARSIRHWGILEPIRVIKTKSGRLLVNSGHRRVEAARMIGLGTVPGYVLDEQSDLDRAFMRLVSNVQREDITDIELAESITEIQNAYPRLTQADIAERIGKTQPTISNLLRLLDLPDVAREMIQSGSLSTAHGMQLLRIGRDEYDTNGLTGRTRDEMRIAFAQEAVEATLSVRRLGKKVDDYLERQERLVKDNERIRKQKETSRMLASGENPEPTPETVAASPELISQLRTSFGKPVGEDPSPRMSEAEWQAARAPSRNAANERDERFAAVLQQRDAVANAVINEIFDYKEGPRQSLDFVRYAAARTLEGARLHRERSIWLTRIESASDEAELMTIIFAIHRQSFVLDETKCRLEDTGLVSSWIERQWNISHRIANRLLSAGLIVARSYERLLGRDLLN